ncbi:MAG TPA: hypothetical protein VLV17_08865 [Anaeromyxobacteraceae bacterium]|nr:hypothetical protein [Anaeromyxobacteraceae bacterium]
MKRILASAACAVLAACGGGSSSNGNNAALGTTFTYGAPQAASGTQTAAVQDQVETILGVQATPSTTNAFNAADFTGLTGTLLGGQAADFPAVESAPVSIARAAVAHAGPRFAALAHDVTFQDPNCAVETPTSVTLTNCVITDTGITVDVSGSLTVDPTARTATWSFTASMAVTDLTVNYSFSGHVAVTDTTLQATLLADLNGTGTANGTTETIGASESAVVDLTYVSSPTTCVTGGTIEAKFVWTALPSGVSYPNEAAKLTFTGTGSGCATTATIATST